MRQILQNARSGELRLTDVPAPAVGSGQVLVENHFSVVSPGTDKLAMSFVRKSLLAKARSRPDLVDQVVRKLRHEGPLPTYRTVTNKLDAPQPLGYSCAGIVRAVAPDVTEFVTGDRVACAGAGYANHAELVAVPVNLVARVPDGLGLDEAAFATLGAIALQGVRIADPSLGEAAVVVGLGLIGQLTVQLLAANGCRILGVDLDERRIKEALDLGAEWGATPDALADGWHSEATAGLGVDFAMVTASSTSSAPIQLSAGLCRPRGRVVVVGAMPLELDRRTFYEKELALRLSMSYGPGRYDRRYEELGLDYPLPYVRWTENRNLQAFLALAAAGRIAPRRLDAETVSFERATEAYEELANGKRKNLAVVFRYAEAPDHRRTLEVSEPATRPRGDSIGVGFLGAGNYAKSVLLPALAGRASIRPVALATATGPSAKRTAERFRFERCGTDASAVVADPDVDLVFVTTRHDLHASQAIAALRAGKAVWLEKPVALDPSGVEDVAEAVRDTGGFLMVGYNRRFSVHTRAIQEILAKRTTPLSLQYTIAAGAPPRGTWITDPDEGGGRIVGECCHFVDLCTFLVGRSPSRVFATGSGLDPEIDDSTTAVLGYPDGSTATIHYLARASGELPKERFEVSAGGITLTCENFKQTHVRGAPGGVRRMNQDKGQAAAIGEVLDAVRAGRPSPIPLDDIVTASMATFAILESQRSGRTIDL